VISAGSSVLRIVAGHGFWFTSLEGLTPNHKTLAVWMAPFVPWLLWRRDRWLIVLVAAALLLSTSKSAWAIALLGAAWTIHHDGRPLVARWRITTAVVAGAALLSIALPAALNSPSTLAEIEQRTGLGIEARMMLDAARSRQSLTARSAQMLARRPLLGQGPGTSVHVEQVEFPHYRVNGVDAHGVLQKVASETGVLGLGAWLAFTIALGWRAASRVVPGSTRGAAWAWLGVLVCLHASLLTSTEAFTMTHWIPLGLSWFALHRDGATS
jgi:O-antigen ligase